MSEVTAPEAEMEKRVELLAKESGSTQGQRIMRELSISNV